jgi:hypothetical protein
MSSGGDTAGYGVHTTVGGGAYTRDRARNSPEPIANEVMDWDSAYRQERVFEGSPWNIGEPKPELASG